VVASSALAFRYGHSDSRARGRTRGWWLCAAWLISLVMFSGCTMSDEQPGGLMGVSDDSDPAAPDSGVSHDIVGTPDTASVGNEQVPVSTRAPQEDVSMEEQVAAAPSVLREATAVGSLTVLRPGLGSPCLHDSHCPAQTWCPTGTLAHLRRCAPRHELGDVSFPMVFVPAGVFPRREIASGHTRYGVETTQHLQHADVFVGQSEVTQGQWRAVMEAHNRATGMSWGTDPSRGKGGATCLESDCPVVNVNLWEALQFANAMSAAVGLPDCYEFRHCSGADHFTGADVDNQTSTPDRLRRAYGCRNARHVPDCSGYRLATGLEWERMARADAVSLFWWGDDPSPIMAGVFAWTGDTSSGHAHRAGTSMANAFAVHDAVGNVAEWTFSPGQPASEDWTYQRAYGAAFYNERVRGSNAVSPSDHVVYRSPNDRSRSSSTGLRLALSVPQPTAFWCPVPESPDFGFVNTTGHFAGASAIYGCDTGYALTENALRFCGADGRWSGRPPRCQPVDCGPPPEFDLASLVLNGTTRGDHANYVCAAGFAPSMPNRLVCADDGRWEGEVRCVPTSELCDSDADCTDAMWCPEPTLAGLRRCAPRPGDTPELAMPFLWVPAGSFVQGMPMSAERHRGYRAVITRPFWIAQRKVTQAQWAEATGGFNPFCIHRGWTHECHPPNTDRAAPVSHIDWYSALAFANWMSRRDGLPECYELHGCEDPTSGWHDGRHDGCQSAVFSELTCPGYRLPTESEWERAAQAGELRHIMLAAEDVATPISSDDCWNPPSQFRVRNGVQPNGFGLCDIVDIVSEWVWDHVLDEYNWFEYPLGTHVDYMGPDSGRGRGYRGGNIYGPPTRPWYGFRDASPPDNTSASTGLRLVRSVSGVQMRD
jgi:sulfatase modifying factor 1